MEERVHLRRIRIIRVTPLHDWSHPRVPTADQVLTIYVPCSNRLQGHLVQHANHMQERGVFEHEIAVLRCNIFSSKGNNATDGYLNMEISRRSRKCAGIALKE